MNIKEILEIRQELERKYSDLYYSKYFRFCFGSQLWQVQEDFGKIELKEGESLDSICLVCSMNSLPTDLELVSEIKGLRVFYEVGSRVVR